MSMRILLHACCAPCSIAIIDELRSRHAVTALFYNPNIDTEEEYQRRKREVVKLCAEWAVPTIDLDRDEREWERVAGSVPQAQEGGPRCSACFRMRLFRTAEIACDRGFDSFASSLTSGRRKRSEVINAIGTAVGRHLGVPFVATDWKKGGRIERAETLVAERGIYRQWYCGCRYSRTDAETRSRVALEGSVVHSG